MKFAFQDRKNGGIVSMKIFGVSTGKDYDGYGIDCGIVIAESKEEARRIVRGDTECYMADDEDIFEIPFEKGFTLIGSYSE